MVELAIDQHVVRMLLVRGWLHDVESILKERMVIDKAFAWSLGLLFTKTKFLYRINV